MPRSVLPGCVTESQPHQEQVQIDESDLFTHITPGELSVPRTSSQIKPNKPKQHSEVARDLVASLLKPRADVKQRWPSRNVPRPSSRASTSRTRKVVVADGHAELTASTRRMFLRGKGRASSPLFKQVSHAFTSGVLRTVPSRASSRMRLGTALPTECSRTDLLEVRILPPANADTDVSIIDLPEEGLRVFPSEVLGTKHNVQLHRQVESSPSEEAGTKDNAQTAFASNYIAAPRALFPGRAGGALPKAKSKPNVSMRERLGAAMQRKMKMLQNQKPRDAGSELAKSCRKGDAVDLMKVAPNAWLQQQNWRWGRTALTWETPDDKRDERKDEARRVAQTELTVFEAFDFAEKLNLPPGQVTEAWNLFRCYDADEDGQLTPQEFQLLLRNVLRDQFPAVRDIPRELFKPMNGIANKRGVAGSLFSFSDFLTWLTEFAFDESILLTEEQRSIRRFARQHNAPIPVVEVVKSKFDSYDENGNGQIEFQEFYDLLFELLGMSPEMRDCLPYKRVRTFWREIDYDSSGVIEFDEFIPWYLRYFDPSGRSVGISPLEEFYASIRPFPHMPRHHGHIE